MTGSYCAISSGGARSRKLVDILPHYTGVVSAGRTSRRPACGGMLFSERFHMSGHSKWATIKHKKAALDAKRGKAFTRIIKEITIAARNGGDPDGNPRLRTAILAAKAVSMPADNIKKAVMRGTGELEGGQIEEVMFEGYGPGGAAVLVNVATDNRNRTVSEIRHAFSKNGGNMGEQGSVAWMFERKSHIVVSKEKASEDQLMNIVLDAGADDLRNLGDQWEILSDPSSHENVLKVLEANKIPTE